MLRKELHQYITESDNKLIKMVYALSTLYKDDTDNINAKDLKMFDYRTERNDVAKTTYDVRSQMVI